MMYLFFDTETTGFPCSPTSDYRNWPRMVQLGWLLTDEKGQVIVKNRFLIQPRGFTIPKRATEIHGITTQQARNEGILPEDALHRFLMDVTYAKVLIAHNVDYDYGVLRSELLRHNIPDFLRSYQKFCTMKAQSIVNLCRILRGDDRSKWPRLSELYYLLFDAHHEGAHDALEDAWACAQCYFELKKRGVV
jgi:DNA polymerase-3 subunit epsilon